MKKTIIAIIIALTFVGCAQIDQTERGIILEFGKVDEVVEPGLTIYNFITKQVLKISVKTELQETRIESGSKDMQTVNVTVAVNYRIDPSKVDQVYTQYGMNGVEIALQPKIKETITGVTPQYTAEEMLQKREEIRQRMETTLKSKLLKNNDIRAVIDDRNEKIGKKIRDNELKRIPYLLIVGERESAEGTVSVRKQGGGDQGVMTTEEFAKKVNEEVDATTKAFMMK